MNFGDGQGAFLEVIEVDKFKGLSEVFNACRDFYALARKDKDIKPILVNTMVTAYQILYTQLQTEQLKLLIQKNLVNSGFTPDDTSTYH